MKVSTDLYYILPTDWNYITRGDDPKKVLSEKAKKLLSQIVYKLEESKSGKIFLRHKFFSKYTGCSIQQNTRILKQLSDIIDSQYYYSIELNDVQYLCGYLIQFTKDGKDRITNPLNFYSKV